MTKVRNLGYDVDDILSALIAYYSDDNPGQSIASCMTRDGLLPAGYPPYPPHIGNAELTEKGVNFIRLLMI